MKPIRIGLLVAGQGPAGLWAPSALACAGLAAHELNTGSGILGRPVELIEIDSGPDGRSAAAAAMSAVEFDEVNCLIGMFPSYARRPVIEAVSGSVPLIYTPQFEGLETSLNIVTTGETSGELLAPAVEWLMRHRHAHRFFLCGSDYVWPRSSFAIARSLIRRAGGTVAGEHYLPLECHDYDALFDAIRASGADVVVPQFLGLDSVQFNRAFAAAGLARHMVRLAPGMDETVVYGLDEGGTENLYVASAYFSAVRSDNNGAFLERYHSLFGDTPPPANAYGQSCYEGIYCFAALAEAAGTLAPGRVNAAFGQTRQRKTARGSVAAPVVGTRHPIHIAEVDSYDIRILQTL